MNHLKTTILLLGSISGCSDPGPKQNDTSTWVAPDATQLINFSSEDLRIAREKAGRGDVNAARRLYDYYLTRRDEKEIEIWETWLVDKDDAGALERRAELIFHEARGLPDKNPRKLELLRRAVELDGRASKSSSKEEKGPVLVNGRWVQISPQRDTFAERMKEEIARVEALQGVKPNG